MGTAKYWHYHRYRDNSNHCFCPSGLGTSEMVGTRTFDFIHNRKLGIRRTIHE
jgi:hypothetical protein